MARTREDVIDDLALANTAANMLRDRRHGITAADRVHEQINQLLDELARTPQPATHVT